MTIVLLASALGFHGNKIGARYAFLIIRYISTDILLCIVHKNQRFKMIFMQLKFGSGSATMMHSDLFSWVSTQEYLCLFVVFAISIPALNREQGILLSLASAMIFLLLQQYSYYSQSQLFSVAMSQLESILLGMLLDIIMNIIA